MIYTTQTDLFIGQTTYVGIDTRVLNMAYTSQRWTNSCWAACIQFISKYYGIAIDQDYFMKNYCGVDMWGNTKDCGAPVDVITKYSNNVCTKTHCINSSVFEEKPDLNYWFYLLQNNIPIIAAYGQGIGNPGHAVVVTGMTVKRTFFGETLYSIIVRDPDGKSFLNKMNSGRKEYQGPSFIDAVYAWWVPSVERF